jgi:hypothetical protein
MLTSRAAASSRTKPVKHCKPGQPQASGSLQVWRKSQVDHSWHLVCVDLAKNPVRSLGFFDQVFFAQAQNLSGVAVKIKNSLHGRFLGVVSAANNRAQ